MSDDPLTGARLYADVERYVALGRHRTGSRADHATAEWLAEALIVAGFRVERQEWHFDRYDVGRACVTASGQRVFGLPQWPVRTTKPGGIRAKAAPIDGDLRGKIAVVSFPYSSHADITNRSYEALLHHAFAGGAAAVIAVTEGPTGEVIALNAPNPDPWPIPVLLVAPREAGFLWSAAQNGGELHLVIEADLKRGASALNAIGRLEHGRATVVVSTPMSGWYTCGGERGPGIALWRGLARWAAARKDPVNWCFVATSGHEIGHGGMNRFMHDGAPAQAETLLWLHLGAGIATWRWRPGESGSLVTTGEVNPDRYCLASAPILDSARDAFEGEPGLETPIEARHDRAAGEFADVLRHGYEPALSIFSACQHHHVPGDVAANTDGAILEPVARGLVHIIANVIELSGR